MNILYCLVGLPGSGKTSWSKQMSSEDTIHVSSDEIRKELYNNVNDREHNGETFAYMKDITKKNLLIGKNVIYDATNINSKKRMSLLNEIKKIQCKKVCIYFATSFADCCKNNLNRDRQVDIYSIERMYKTLQIPMYHEGWDEIHIVGEKSNKYSININNINSYTEYESFLNNPITKQCIDFAQDTLYHTLSVSRHMYYVYKYINNNEKLAIAAMLHDIGKPICKNFKEGNKYANFYGHENVSAQLAIEYLLNCNYDDDTIIHIATYIQLHMRLLNLNDNYKARANLLDKIGHDLFNDLIILRNADVQAK